MKNLVEIEDIEGLRVYYPDFSRVDLACGTMPSTADEDVIMMCEAAFTGKREPSFYHENVAGDHVCGGKFYKGYDCDVNTGAFVYYDGRWKFLLGKYDDEVKKAAQNGGMAFGQNMIIYDGVLQPSFRELDSRHQFRALCELKGRLCIIDLKEKIEYSKFLEYLMKAGVTHALYLDMGTPWNYSWYRKADGTVEFIHSIEGEYNTNWIVFYR